MRFKLLIIFSLLICASLEAQDTFHVDGDALLNHSIADELTVYESIENVSFEYFLEHKSEFPKKKLVGSVANLDFTSSTYFIHFTLISESNYSLVLETARPITNEVSLYAVSQDDVAKTGDGIPFNEKRLKTNRSVVPMSLQPGSNDYILKLRSDGEALSVPFILWDKNTYEYSRGKNQFFVGIFFGIFLFVIIIYLTFYVLLRDSLFLLYTVYVFMSGLLQFALDGYLHQYVLKSGGYLTQHALIIIAGWTVFFALHYASRYLKLEGRNRKITNIFSFVVVATILASLIPGKIYEICYPLINGFSLLSLCYLIFIASRIRRKRPEISRLFLIGLSSLLAGGIIFIFGNFGIIDYPSLTQNSLKAGTLVEIICLSILMAGKYKSLQDEKEEAQRQLVIELEEKNKIMEDVNIRLEQQVADRTKEIESQRAILKEKNDDLLASITYAKRIQTALLSNDVKFKEILPESFIFFKPKDIVSGDFFWIDEIPKNEHWPNGLIVYATADCTGHGVPGAFVSIICNNLLKLGTSQPEVNNPGEALDFANAELNQILNSRYSDTQIRDGMDVALCAIDPVERKLYFAGAKNGLYLLRDGEVIDIKADRKAIGVEEGKEEFHFNTSEVQLQAGDMLYSLSDGYVDQFGGPNGKKFTSKRLKEMLVRIHQKEMNEQLEVVENTFDIWCENEEQIDDVLLIGVRIS